MFGIIILYLLIGVTFNYLWDVTVYYTGSEEYRFTVKERFIVVMIWPIVLGFGLATFIAALFKK